MDRQPLRGDYPNSDQTLQLVASFQIFRSAGNGVQFGTNPESTSAAPALKRCPGWGQREKTGEKKPCLHESTSGGIVVLLSRL